MNYSNLTDEELERLLYMRLGRSPIIDAAYKKHAKNMGGYEEVLQIEAQMDEMVKEKCPVCEADLYSS